MEQIFKKTAMAVLFASTVAAGSVWADEGLSRSEAAQKIESFTEARTRYKAEFDQIMANNSREEAMQKLQALQQPKMDDDLLDIARQVYINGPYDELAFTALDLVRKNDRDYKGERRAEALDILLDNYITHPELMSALSYVFKDIEEKVAIYDRIYTENPSEAVKAEATMLCLQSLASEIGKPMMAERRQALADQAMLLVTLLKGKYADQVGKDFMGEDYQMGAKADEVAATIQGHLELKQLQNIQLNTLEGEPDQLTNYRGKYVLLDFWATWCGPCKAGIPGLVKLKEELKGKPFEIIAISGDDDAEAALQYQEEEQAMPWVHWFAGAPADNELFKQLDIQGLPTYILLDQSGNILSRTHYLDDRGKAFIKQLVKSAK